METRYGDACFANDSRPRQPPWNRLSTAPKRVITTTASLLLSLALALVLAPQACRGWQFTRSFAEIEQGTGLLLIWEPVAAEYMPLTVSAQLINRTGDDNRANVFRRNLTTGLNASSWLWRDVPAPLEFLPAGLYQVEVRPESGPAANPLASGANATLPVFPRSPHFRVLEVKARQPSGPSPPPPAQGGGASNSRTVSMVVGLVVGLALLAAACVAVYVWRRRHVRAREERMRRDKFAIVIN